LATAASNCFSAVMVTGSLRSAATPLVSAPFTWARFSATIAEAASPDVVPLVDPPYSEATSEALSESMGRRSLAPRG